MGDFVLCLWEKYRCSVAELLLTSLYSNFMSGHTHLLYCSTDFGISMYVSHYDTTVCFGYRGMLNDKFMNSNFVKGSLWYC